MLSFPARRLATGDNPKLPHKLLWGRSSAGELAEGDKLPWRHWQSEGRLEHDAPGVPPIVLERRAEALVVGHGIDDRGHRGPPLAADAYFSAMRSIRLSVGLKGAFTGLPKCSSRSRRLTQIGNANYV
jgi:hypothetical protein